MNSNQKLSLYDHIGYWLNKFGQQVRFSFEKKLASENVTIPQWCIIISLYNGDASSVIELANFIGIDKGAISRVIDQLKTMKLVFCQAGHDRRSNLLCLSKKGEHLALKLAGLANFNDNEFFSILSKNEKKHLKAILKKLLCHAGINSIGGWLSE